MISSHVGTQSSSRWWAVRGSPIPSLKNRERWEMHLVSPNLDLPESRDWERTQMLIVYVGGDPKEQERQCREDETGEKDKPTKGAFLNLFHWGSILLDVHWGTSELSLQMAGGQGIYLMTFIGCQWPLIILELDVHRWLLNGQKLGTFHLIPSLLCCPLLPAPELSSGLLPILLCSLSDHVFLISFPGFFSFFHSVDSLLDSILVFPTSAHSCWANQFMKWFHLFLLWCQLPNPPPLPNFLSWVLQAYIYLSI